MTIALSSLLPMAMPQDVSGLSDAVGAVLGQRPASVTLERTHFPGKRPVQLVLSAGFAEGRNRTVYAEFCPEDPQGHAESVRASLAKSRHGQKAGFDADAVQVDAGTGLVLRRPGLDERLPGLRLLYDEAFARRTVQMILGRDFGPVATELVAHRLGKRAVLRITGSGLDVFVRVRSIKSGEEDDRLARHRALWCSLSATSDLRIPEPLGAVPDIGASFFGVLAGKPPEFGTSDAGPIARAVAALQALDPAGLAVHSGRDEAGILQQWLERCRDGRPELARRIAPGLARRIAALEATGPALRPCHRDLHEKQILVADGVAGLLDFDTLCLADPALDAGNLLAHLFLAGVDEAPLRARLDCPGLGLWRSAALYRLAMIYAFTSVPVPALDRLIEEADADADD